MELLFCLKFLSYPQYEWLKKSQLYEFIKDETLDNSELEEELPYPYCSVQNSNIDDLLKVIDFWGITELPFEVYDTFYNLKPKDILQSLVEIHTLNLMYKKLLNYAFLPHKMDF